MASKMHFSYTMKTCTHELVSRLLELHTLEERLVAGRKSREDTCDVEALIDSLRAHIPVSVLIVHHRMRSHGKRSVAEVCHGVCFGCHIALAIGNVNALKAGTLLRCGNCGRYLYTVEEEANAVSAPPAKSRRRVSQRSTDTPETKQNEC